ncbi:uncharacterized protein [Apostichopus japonicus]|uniref:uncharacterized protein isoform X3 n=1 Tax=Stichopus japonicus TaxID=307972 RepID=UPI003AB4D8C1
METCVTQQLQPTSKDRSRTAKNNQVMTALVNPTYNSDAGSPADQVNANTPLSMADVTDILENELKCLNEKLGETLKVKGNINNDNTQDTRTNPTMPATKSRTKYASTNFTSMGIGNPLENLPGFDLDEDLPEEEEDDGRLTVADDNILREMNKKKAEQMFADIDFIDDGEDEEIEEEEEEEEEQEQEEEEEEEVSSDDQSEKLLESDSDPKQVKDDESTKDKKSPKDPDADVASPSDHVLGNKLRGFLNYYADFEALARARADGVEEDTASLNGSVSDSDSESREGLYEPPQHPPPFDSGPSTMEDDSTDDCESTYAMLYKSFGLRSQEEGYTKDALSPTSVQPDHGYASETSTDDRMSPIKRPGLLSKDGLKNSLAVLTEDAKNGTEIQTQLQMSPGVEPESGIEVTPEPKGESHMIDLGKPSTSQKTALTKPTSLPPGWREVADTHGTYYWHIPSGTTQWTPPADSLDMSGSPPKKPARMADSKEADADCESDKSLKEFQQSTLRYASLKLAPGASERKEGRSISVQNPKGIRFHVRSLGWVEMEDSDLSPGKSSLAVNNCIRQLSYRKTDIRDVAGIWGEGKDMYMVLEDEYLKLTDTNDSKVLNSQHVCSIRVWGVGRDNGRDFAYVARDKVTRRYKCHVFRCDIPAKTIANALHEICAKVMSERQKGNTISMVTQGQMIRQQQQQQLMKMKSISLDSSKETNANTVDFPTPKAEPITVFRANYIGSTEVSCSGAGMETLNEAINKVFDMTPADQWMPVRIEVAVSTVTVTSVRTKEVITENRIRFLSFLGIGPDIRQFGYIMCVGKNKFQCHVFCCEHSAGGLAKAIEAACKLRYQKCLDARPKNNFLTTDCGDGKTWGCALKSGVQSLFSRFTVFKNPPEATVSAV